MVLKVLSGRTTIVPFGDNMMQVANLPYMVQPLPAAFNAHQKNGKHPSFRLAGYRHVPRQENILCTRGNYMSNINTGWFHSCTELIKCYFFILQSVLGLFIQNTLTEPWWEQSAGLADVEAACELRLSVSQGRKMGFELKHNWLVVCDILHSDNKVCFE